jgi:hypothetical protein
MKTNLYKTALLIALVFAAFSTQAQSARRPAAQNEKERTASVRSTTRQTSATQAKSTQAARTVNKQTAHTQQARSNQPVKKVPAQQVRNQPVKKVPVHQVQTQHPGNSQSARSVHQQQVRNQNTRNGQPVNNTRTQQARKPVSMTTTKNPGSTYRSPVTRVTSNQHYTAPVKSTKYRSSRYYGGNVYHYAYPTRKVNIHYHHNTYVNGYHVLYYPTYGDIFWTRSMYRHYYSWYPGYYWSYNYGYRIQTISIFDAKYNLGEVARVYGRVYATWFNEETDDYLLFFGGDFPNQQFTVVIPGHIARKYSWRPENYFLGEHITVTGLISTYDGSPEIVVKNKTQLDLY